MKKRYLHERFAPDGRLVSTEETEETEQEYRRRLRADRLRIMLPALREQSRQYQGMRDEVVKATPAETRAALHQLTSMLGDLAGMVYLLAFIVGDGEAFDDELRVEGP